MIKKLTPFLLIIGLLAVLYFVRQQQGDYSGKGFDRRTNFLEYSKHASCRMDCRKISKSEVEEIMKDGKINYNKSDLQNKRCPRYALEGITHDNQKVRIIFAQCKTNTTVVTVIDLKNEWQCHCPGDKN